MTLSIRENASLKPFNTFAVDAMADLLVEAHDEAEIHQALTLAEQRSLPLLLLGGGSNVLFTRDQQALVLCMKTRGLRILTEDGEQAIIEAEAGEPWHQLVLWTLRQGFAGLENLSLIPGTAGAAPVQNIGAYGVELKDVLHSLVALDRESGATREFFRDDCRFDYRDSRFKREAGRWIILRIRLHLSKKPALHLDYGPIRNRLQEQGISQPTPTDVSDAVCAIRSEKLPDPARLGNAGSFFKNPVVAEQQAERLRQQYPNLVAYPVGNGQVKLAAGWLIDQAGWKGFREGDCGVHSQQALVLVNYGAASGEQILALAKRIQADILQRFAVTLEIEPTVR